VTDVRRSNASSPQRKLTPAERTDLLRILAEGGWRTTDDQPLESKAYLQIPGEA
jgi:hypothetical protein